MNFRLDKRLTVIVNKIIQFELDPRYENKDEYLTHGAELAVDQTLTDYPNMMINKDFQWYMARKRIEQLNSRV